MSVVASASGGQNPVQKIGRVVVRAANNRFTALSDRGVDSNDFPGYVLNVDGINVKYGEAFREKNYYTS